MLLIQTRAQNIFNRFYLLFTKFAVVLIAGVIAALINQQSMEHIQYFFYLLASFFIFYPLWLSIFNAGKSKVIEYGLVLNEQGISYIQYGAKQHIAWSDFTGFESRNNFPRMICLKSAAQQDIVFSYYTFSSSQRRKLFNYLSAK